MSELKTGTVYQTFGDGSVAGPYILKELPWGDHPYWRNRVWVYKPDGRISHTVHTNLLSNDRPISSQAS